MKKLIGLFVCILLVSCTGPVQVAKNEHEVFKTTYDDPELARVYHEDEAPLHDIYQRYHNAGIDFYYDGVAVVGLKDPTGKTEDHYLSIKIRPAEIVFERDVSDPDKWPVRFKRITHQEFPKYIKYLKESDLMKLKDIQGVAFGIYWPLRDYTQCDKYGGCIEYAIIYLTTKDVADILSGARPFLDIAKERHLVASFNLRPAETVKVN